MPAAPFPVVYQEGDKKGRGELFSLTSCFFLLMKYYFRSADRHILKVRGFTLCELRKLI